MHLREYLKHLGSLDLFKKKICLFFLHAHMLLLKYVCFEQNLVKVDSALQAMIV